MKSLQTAIQNRDLSALQGMMGTDKPTSVKNEAAADLFNELFRQLRAAFPAAVATIKNQDDLNVLRQQWTLAFKENGINTVAQIEAGMAIARRQESPFLPAPGQFIAWCHEGKLRSAGLPDERELATTLKRFIANRDLYPSNEAYPWRSNAEYWLVTSLYFAGKQAGWSESERTREIKRALADMAKKIESGQQIPAPVITLPKRKSTKPLSGDQGLAKISEIRAKFRLGGRHG